MCTTWGAVAPFGLVFWVVTMNAEACCVVGILEGAVTDCPARLVSYGLNDIETIVLATVILTHVLYCPESRLIWGWKVVLIIGSGVSFVGWCRSVVGVGSQDYFVSAVGGVLDVSGVAS